jgi:hypothetical protein
MTTTYTLIASSTVGSGGVSNISFTSIPATYTDLVVKISTRDSRSTNPYNELTVSFNGSPSYARKTIYGTGTSSGSEGDSSGNFIYSGTSTTTANTFANDELYIPNYRSSSAKSISAETAAETNAATGNLLILAAGSSTLTSAITSVTLTPNGGNTFLQYSTAYLYGIKNS